MITNGHITYEDLCLLWDTPDAPAREKADIATRLEEQEGTAGLLQLAKACIEKRLTAINYTTFERFFTTKHPALVSLATYQRLYGEVDPDFVHSED